MINDATILKFEFDEGAPSEVQPAVLATLCQGIENAFAGLTQPFCPARVQLYIVGTARRGSLEVPLRPEIDGDEEAAKKVLQRFGLQEAVALSAVASGLGALWLIVFGQRGIVDLIKSPDRPPAAEFAITVPQEMLREPHTRNTVEQLAALALRSGAKRITIQVPDHEPVVLAERADSLGRGIIGRMKIHEEVSPPQTIQRMSDVTNVEVNGQQLPAFLCESEFKKRSGTGPRVVRIVAVWRSTAPVPEKGQVVNVQVQQLQPDEVTAVEVAPIEFQRAVAIFAVNKSAEWK